MKSRILIIAFSALIATGCGQVDRPANAPSVLPAEPGRTYVAIGASESLGFGAGSPLREGWTKVLWSNAMPRQTTFVDVAVAGSTTDQAITDQLPQVQQLKPDYVTVWLNVNDIFAGVSASAFESALSDIVSAVSADTNARVLIANTPPLDQLPVYLRARNGDTGGRSPLASRPVPAPAQLNKIVDQYNAATERVAKANRATVVDLHTVGLAARSNGTAATLISEDGFHPSTKGHAAIAKAFTDALGAA